MRPSFGVRLSTSWIFRPPQESPKRLGRSTHQLGPMVELIPHLPLISPFRPRLAMDRRPRRHIRRTRRLNERHLPAPHHAG